MKKILFVSVFLMISISSFAQRWSIGTNFIDYADFGTVNLQGSVAVSRHWTLDAGWSYNPWTFNEGKPDQFQNRSVGGSLGTRWWPWHAFAGWWVNTGVQYEMYNRGGLVKESAEEGEAYGMNMGFGYSLLIGERFNLDFGVGVWGGRKNYVTYRCTSCGRIMDEGEKWFFLPDDVIVSLIYVF